MADSPTPQRRTLTVNLDHPTLDDAFAVLGAYFRARFGRDRPKELIIPLLSGREFRHPWPETGEVAAEEWELSADGRVLCWFGKTYSFTPGQSAPVRLLAEAFRKGKRDVDISAILEAAEAKGDTRVRDVFRRSEAWDDRIIAPGEEKSTYRLLRPSEVPD